MTTDIIVGFPGETEGDFLETLSLLEEVRFGTVYGFVYSPRPGTEAASFEDEVPVSERDERLSRLLAHQREIQARANRSWLGRTVDVLVDGPSKKDALEWTGRTPENRIVNFAALGVWAGKVVSVKVSEVSAYSLRAVPIS